MKIKNVMALLATIGAMAGVLSSCKVDMPEVEQSSFQTMTVKKSNIEIPIRFSAKMKGQSDVTISPQVNGQLMRICVTEGEQVRKGQTLFVIDSRNAQSDLQSAQANLQAAQANLQAALAQANSAKLEYESNKNLYDKKIVSSYTLETSHNAYRQAEAAVSQARAAVTQAQASVNQARVNLGFCTITAPVAGIVGEIPVRAGDQVSPMTQLTMVSGNQQMEAWFSLPESIIEESINTSPSDKDKYIDALPEVTFVMKNGTEYPHKGRISSLTGMVDVTTGSLSCKATFPNPDGGLYSGVQGSVVLPLNFKDVIVIPQNAVVRLQDKTLVYKVKPDNTATAVNVTIEDAGNGKDFIITSGLDTGDRIVTVGANNVTEGQQVIFPEADKKEKK